MFLLISKNKSIGANADLLQVSTLCLPSVPDNRMWLLHGDTLKCDTVAWERLLQSLATLAPGSRLESPTLELIRSLLFTFQIYCHSTRFLTKQHQKIDIHELCHGNILIPLRGLHGSVQSAILRGTMLKGKDDSSACCLCLYLSSQYVFSQSMFTEHILSDNHSPH